MGRLGPSRELFRQGSSRLSPSQDGHEDESEPGCLDPPDHAPLINRQDEASVRYAVRLGTDRVRHSRTPLRHIERQPYQSQDGVNHAYHRRGQ
jgi:hypothetical protein